MIMVSGFPRSSQKMSTKTTVLDDTDVKVDQSARYTDSALKLNNNSCPFYSPNDKCTHS
jgi:hypothetical protein